MEHQQTISKNIMFEGYGIHTGTYSHIMCSPASTNTGIVFVRGGKYIEVIHSNVCNTNRCTTIMSDGVKVMTIEHLMSAAYGVGVDNMYVYIDNIEVPFLDGSSIAFAEQLSNNLRRQSAERRKIIIDKVYSYNLGESQLVITPNDVPLYSVYVDFKLDIYPSLTIDFSDFEEYTNTIAGAKSFVYLSEIIDLYKKGFLKGGCETNANIIIDREATEEELLLLKERNMELSARNDVSLECCRHKLLDLIGDFALLGGRLCAKVMAKKPGHTLNHLFIP